MKIPNGNKAIVPEEKLRKYLLSRSHRQGQFKAAFFSKLGYSDDNWMVLARDLKKQALSDRAEEIGGFSFGRRFVVKGEIRTPGGRPVQMVSVWVILHDEDRPRFVTAYPGR
jgi:hypothetical protein